MTNTEILLGLLSVLTYFAGVQRGKRYRAEDRARHEAERSEARVRGVVDRYRALWVSRESSSLKGVLKSGVLSLQSGEEVREACRLIRTEGLPPAVPDAYMAQLEGLDLLEFFGRISARRDALTSPDVLTRIIQELREGAAA